ncbi:hypothetical protein ANANG_G00193970, partial [Anguilla anguilla]
KIYTVAVVLLQSVLEPELGIIFEYIVAAERFTLMLLFCCKVGARDLGGEKPKKGHLQELWYKRFWEKHCPLRYKVREKILLVR